jgi:7-cyano-7-deazaguanine synthase
MRSKNVLLLSGGIDSCACLHYLSEEGKDTSALYIDYGHAAATREKHQAEKIAKFYSTPFTIITLRSDCKFNAGEIIGRNAFFISTALLFAAENENSGAIILGIHKGTPYFDCSQSFLMGFQQIVSDQTNGRILVRAPFITWNKGEIWDYCKMKKVPVHLTYSCENGLDQPCNACASCRDLTNLYANKI